MSSTQLGNQNASKWTREKTLQFLDKIEAIALDEFSICDTLSQALLRARCYKQLWSYWKKKWENDEEVMDRIYYIEQIFICKLEEGALYKRMNASTCHFILRNNYGYNTKEENELPSHLRDELSQPINEKPLSGSKTKTAQASKTSPGAEISLPEYINTTVHGHAEQHDRALRTQTAVR